jgi:N-acyl-D-aspartate/D-glutamate deacylase
MLDGSAEHGVTTAVLGNCGVGVAPCRPGHRNMLIQDLINVEGMSQQVLEAGIRWNWESFPQYIAAAAASASTINRAFLVPLAPLRTYVLGTEATERAATAAETATIAGLLQDAMQAGASGFSSTSNRAHIGYQGKPVAARLASRDEYTAYCGVLKESAPRRDRDGSHQQVRHACRRRVRIPRFSAHRKRAPRHLDLAAQQSRQAERLQGRARQGGPAAQARLRAADADPLDAAGVHAAGRPTRSPKSRSRASTSSTATPAPRKQRTAIPRSATSFAPS